MFRVHTIAVGICRDGDDGIINKKICSNKWEANANGISFPFTATAGFVLTLF